MLTVPGDIPGATADEFAAIGQAARPAHSFTIVPAHDRRGSNAILLRPPDAVPLRFGDDSFEPHLQAARNSGIEPINPDLAGYRARPRSAAGRASLPRDAGRPTHGSRRAARRMAQQRRGWGAKSTIFARMTKSPKSIRRSSATPLVQ